MMKFLLAAFCLAVTSAGGMSMPLRAMEQPEVVEPAAPVVSVNYAGGTVAAYVEALRKAAQPKPVNVILSRSAAAETIAPISLQNVGLDTALMAIEPAAGVSSGTWRIRRIDPRSPGVTGGQGTSPAFSIDFAEARAAPSAEPASVEVFSIASLVRMPGVVEDVPLLDAVIRQGEGRLSLQAVLDAVRSALEIGEDRADKPELKYHEESSLLIVRGTAKQHRAVRQVIERLEMDRDRTTSRAAEAAKRQRALEIDAQRLRIDMQVQAQELHVRQQELAEALKLVEAGAAPTSHRTTLEIVVAKSQARLQQLELELKRIELEMTGAAGAAGAAERTYGVEGLASKMAAVYRLIEVMREADASDLPRYHHADGGALVLTATERQHKVFAAAIAGMRAAR